MLLGVLGASLALAHAAQIELNTSAPHPCAVVSVPPYKGGTPQQ